MGIILLKYYNVGNGMFNVLDNGMLRMLRFLRVIQLFYFTKTPVYRCLTSKTSSKAIA